MAEPRPSFLASPSRPRPFTPADAPKEKLFALHAMLGIRHCVIVQSTCHGFDNRVVAEAIAAKNGDYCGVALVPPAVDDAELRRLDSQGFCGVRFNFMSHLGKRPAIEDAIALTPRLAKLGWHLQVHFEASLIDELAPWLKRSAVPVVIDHMGRVDASLGLEQPAFGRLLDLMRDPRFRVITRKRGSRIRSSRRPKAGCARPSEAATRPMSSITT